MQTDFDTFAYYDGIEEDSDVADALKRYGGAGHFKCCNSLAKTEKYLGAKPVLTKLGCVKKTRVNPTIGASSTKTRLTVDSKQSRVTAASKRTNTVKGLLGLLKGPEYAPGRLEGADIELLLADVSDAF